MANHNKLIREMKHFGCNVTDLCAKAPVIKLTSQTYLIQGLLSSEKIKTLHVTRDTLYIVGDEPMQIHTAMNDFCNGMRSKMGLNVHYNPDNYTISA